MTLRDFLRNWILGSSLAIPNTNEVWSLIKYEIKNRMAFSVYLLLILVVITLSLWISLRNNKKTYLVFTLAFSLLFCAFLLQKVAGLDLEDKKSTRSNEKSTSSLLRRTTKVYKMVERFIGLDENLPLNYLKTKNVQVMSCVPKKQDTTEDQINTTENQLASRDNLECTKNQTSTRKDSTMNYLIQLHSVFLDHKKNLIEQKKFTRKLSQIEIKSKEELKKFKTSFDTFMKKSKVIESEMLGFNAPIRFLQVEFENLSNEIEKYFSILREFKDENSSSISLIYLENILKTNRVLNGTTEDSIIKTDGISRHTKWIKMMIIVITISLVFIFVVVVLDITFLEVFIVPCVCIMCCLFLIASIFILVDAQVLDRNCKTGTVKDCNFDLYSANRYLKDIRQTEFVKQSEIFRNDMEEARKISETRSKQLLNYTSRLLKDRLREEINVFLNLFDKIIFVNENFDDLTSHKIESDSYYATINKMIKSLGIFQNLFSEDLKDEALNLLLNEYKFYFFITQEKDVIVSKTRSIVLGRTHKKSSLRIKKCLSILEDLCRARDKLDVVFNSIVIAAPLILISVTF